MASGKKTATTAAIQMRLPYRPWATGPPLRRPRTASATRETGLTSDQACSQPAISVSFMKTLLAKVSGRIRMVIRPCTEVGFLISMPR